LPQIDRKPKFKLEVETLVKNLVVFGRVVATGTFGTVLADIVVDIDTFDLNTTDLTKMFPEIAVNTVLFIIFYRTALQK